MLLDSNIIILASKLLNIQLLDYLRKNEKDLKVSILSKIEVLGYHQLKEVEHLYLRNFFNAIPLLPLSVNVSEKAISLRQRKPISLADAIIAATALEYELPLFTDNVKDYAGIKDLQVFSTKDIL